MLFGASDLLKSDSQKHLFLSKELIAGFAITRKATFYCQRIRDMKYFVNDFVSCPSWSDLFINLCCLKFHLLRFCWQMVLKLVSKMLTHKCFFQPIPFGWLCSNTVSGEHKHQLERNRNFRGTLEELFDPKDTTSKLKCHCKFMNVSLCHEQQQQQERTAFVQWLFHVCKPSPQLEIKDCLQSTSIYLVPTMSKLKESEKEK